MSTNFLHQSAFGEKYCHQYYMRTKEIVCHKSCSLRMVWTRAKTEHTDLMSEGSDKSQFSICVKIPAETEFLFSEQFNSNKTFLAPFYISLQLTDTLLRDQMPAQQTLNSKIFSIFGRKTLIHWWLESFVKLDVWCNLGLIQCC